MNRMLVVTAVVALAVLAGAYLADIAPEPPSPEPGDNYTVGNWTVSVLSGEVAGFNDNWVLRAGVESSEYDDRRLSIVHNCLRSYNMAVQFNSRYEDAENPCYELNRTLHPR